ncbi:hypothetical protein Taro_010329 [Colocasia esculenta]|uniref:Replication protein A 70 kDa DNA-binding subunit B/D first OB fold domain-containing protein n=1 Tax=Colocasia esculenta TaxID=4460 RepID=A0A843U319_COLES|nr:hypothetical protein [Colocasia esculenta]
MKKSLINKFNCQLKEGSSYIITNFGVGENIRSYKSTQHAFRINFLYSMSIRECHDMLMPTKSFDFITFEDITSNRIDVTYLVDVIGELTGIGNIEEWENNGNKTKGLTFELEDEQLFGGQEISSKIYQISTQSSYSLKEDLLQLTERKFLDEIRETRQDGDTESFPEELDIFLNKRFIFKIQISEFNLQQKWPIYTVIRVTDDDSLIEEYLSSSIDEERRLRMRSKERKGLKQEAFFFLFVINPSIV